MKWACWLFMACIVMALLKLALTVLVMALLVLLVWGAINRPRETLMVVGVLVLAAWPHLLIVLVAVAIIGALLNY